MLPESVNVLMLVIDALDQLQVPYMVGGSMASAFYGVARSTLDADIIADLHQEQTSDLVNKLSRDFYIDELMIREAIRTRSSFNLIHLTTMFKVDVFIRKDRPFDRVQFERRIEQVFATDSEQKVFTASAEDVILAKLDWYRLGGEISDQQWRDILGVMKVQAGLLDLDYLHKWAAELKVSDLLQRALKDSE